MLVAFLYTMLMHGKEFTTLALRFVCIKAVNYSIPRGSVSYPKIVSAILPPESPRSLSPVGKHTAEPR